MKVIELGYVSACDESGHDVEFLNIALAGKGGNSLKTLAGTYLRMGRRFYRQDYDLLVSRSLDRFIYRKDHSFLVNMARWIFRRLTALMVIYGSRNQLPLAVVDITDEPTIDPADLAMVRHCSCFFKRELPVNSINVLQRCPPHHMEPALKAAARDTQELLSKMRPISLGSRQNMNVPRLDLEEAFQRTMSHDEKTYDVFFAGHPGHCGLRSHGLSLLEELADEGYRIKILRESIEIHEFWAAMSRSYLAFSPEGLGWDCIRHYEAALVQSVPIISQPTIRRHQGLQNGRHCYFYEPFCDSLKMVIKNALADKDQLLTMGTAARQWVVKNHVPGARGRYLIEETLRSSRQNRIPQQ